MSWHCVTPLYRTRRAGAAVALCAGARCAARWAAATESTEYSLCRVGSVRPFASPVVAFAKMRGASHNVRLLRVSNRDLNHFDSEEGGVRVLLRAHASRQLVGGPHGRRSRDVDVNIVLVGRVGHQRVGVGPAARLYDGYLFGMIHVGDVINPDAARAVLADRVLHALGAAINPAVCSLGGHHEQVVVHGDIACDPGQTYAVFSVGLLGFEMSQICIPPKLPWMT